MLKEEYDLITEKIIKCAFIVSNQLGAGFLEKVYENALSIELRKMNIYVRQQHPINVYYDNICVGDFFADLIVNNEVLIEIKAVKNVTGIHHAQLLNYLKATGKKVGLLLNFGNPNVEIKRMVNNL